jgi:hypothetical protein
MVEVVILLLSTLNPYGIVLSKYRRSILSLRPLEVSCAIAVGLVERIEQSAGHGVGHFFFQADAACPE